MDAKQVVRIIFLNANRSESRGNIHHTTLGLIFASASADESDIIRLQTNILVRTYHPQPVKTFILED